MERGGYLHVLLHKLAVYSESDTRSVLKRLDMDIRYLHSERRLNHHIDKLYNRSIVDTSIGLSLRKALLHISALVALIFELVHRAVERLRRIELIYSTLYLRLRRDLRNDLHSRRHLQVLENVEVYRVVGRDHKAVMVYRIRENRFLLSYRLGYLRYRLRADLNRRKINKRNFQSYRQCLSELCFGHKSHFEHDVAEHLSAALLFVERVFKLTLTDKSAFQKYLADSYVFYRSRHV